MNNRTLVVGAFALAIGLLLGMLIAPSGPDIAEIRAAVGEELAKAGEKTAALDQHIAGMTDRMTSLSQGMGGIEASVKDLSAKLGTDAQDAGGDVAALATKIEAMASSLTSRVSEAAESQTAALRQGLAALSSGGGAAPAEAPAAAAPAAAVPQTAPAGEPQGLTAGNTASFGDGSVRVTVSRVDDTGGTARLAVNGETVSLAAGESMMVEECKLQLDGVDRGHASLSALCGGDLPEPTGIGPGTAMVLGDGAARVFLSSVAADGSAARFAVNGLTLQTIAAGGSAKVDGTDCAVTVDSIDRGHVSFGYDCGG